MGAIREARRDAGERVRRRARNGPPAGADLLQLTPVRTAVWREDGGRVVVEMPAPAHPWRSPIAWLRSKLSSKRVRLDEIGSFAWTLLDGKRSVGDVAAALQERFGERVEPAGERLGLLMLSLRRGGLIGYRGYDQVSGSAEPG